MFGANTTGAHEAACPFKLLQCPQGCAAKVMRSHLKSHMTGPCERRPVVCPYHMLGCTVGVFAGTIATHCKESAGDHLALVAKRVNRLGVSVESADARVAAIGVSLGTIGPQLGEMAGLSKELLVTSAKAAAGEKALKELEKAVRAMEKGIASIEVELKSQRKDIAQVMTMVDRLAQGRK